MAREAVAFSPLGSLRAHGGGLMPGKNTSDSSKSFAVICSRLPIIVKMPMSSVLEERCAQLSGQ